MNNREIVLVAVDLIENRLQERVSIQEISHAMGYSVFHFSRVFGGVTGLTPREYLQRRRLSEAAREIMNSERRITDIALDYDFGDPASFTRAFRRMFFRSPSSLRREKPDGALKLLERFHTHGNVPGSGSSALEPDQLECGEILMVGIAALVGDSPAIIPELWPKVNDEAALVKRRIKPECYRQVGFWPENSSIDGFFVFLGMDVTALDEIPPSLVAKRLPPARYLRFTHHGLSWDIHQTYRFIFETWLPGSEYRLPLPYDMECYGEKFLGPDNPDSETEIWIPIATI